ncbi:CocE/NonD family hydrolase C-terminal non-catalytic domain-containing protein [Lacticaseibacillus nasuensis]|uniref:CocE/NonD family hydrolase C-terminal non-catalytic domain-containing protein n=1 Tax=Lacticaseibacillus nasuensis TaxID=944671 RepID=UPI00158487E8|nr:CocE/NonD family hydrolase C-terminal non-catalytic domain-containing protein [Lacticaseibacillus nasuensis]
MFEAEIIKPASLYRDARLWLTQAPASDTRVLEGVPHVHLRLWIDAPTGILSVRLVDLGPAKRFGTVAT